MAKISKVGHVVLNVSDTQASAKWYADVLGMELMNYTPGFGPATVCTWCGPCCWAKTGADTFC